MYTVADAWMVMHYDCLANDKYTVQAKLSCDLTTVHLSTVADFGMLAIEEICI